jgi:hypothetical protein
VQSRTPWETSNGETKTGGKERRGGNARLCICNSACWFDIIHPSMHNGHLAYSWPITGEVTASNDSNVFANSSYRRPAAWPRNIRKRQLKENKARLNASLQHVQEADLSLFSRLVECTERRCRRFVLVRSNCRCFLGFNIVWVRRAPLSLARGSTGVNVGPPGDGHSVFKLSLVLAAPHGFWADDSLPRQLPKKKIPFFLFWCRIEHHHDGRLVGC